MQIINKKCLLVEYKKSSFEYNNALCKLQINFV